MGKKVMVTDLYMLTVIFRGSHSARFSYKSAKSADDNYSVLKPPVTVFINEMDEGTSIEAAPSFVEIADDYGNIASIDRREVIGIIRAYVNEDMNADSDLQFLKTHATVKLNKKIATDPMLKTLVPPVNSMPPGFRPQ